MNLLACTAHCATHCSMLQLKLLLLKLLHLLFVKSQVHELAQVHELCTAHCTTHCSVLQRDLLQLLVLKHLDTPCSRRPSWPTKHSKHNTAMLLPLVKHSQRMHLFRIGPNFVICLWQKKGDN